MSYQPVVPASGMLGWRFLTRTLEQQQDLHASAPQSQRDTKHFMENISKITSAEELVNDRQMLRVALGAFGLQDDINSKAFVQKVLEGGTEDGTALAVRLSDERYKDFADAFGFGNIGGSRTGLSSFGSEIVDQFRSAQFEVAVGDQSDDMRLALYAQRELPELAARDSSETTKWYLVLGNAPLREVFEKALALPDDFGSIDVEKQVETLQDLSSRRLGIDSISDLSDESKLNTMVERYILRAQAEQFSASTSSSSIALTLLQNL